MAYPYYNPNPYMNYGNQYYQPQQMQQPVQQQIQPQVAQPTPQSFVKPLMLQGKSVDNIEVVKATDIPLDGSISYFPLVDGTAIVTKQLLPDGTSKMTIYKPSEGNENVELPKYITEKDLDEKIKNLQVTDYSSDIKSIKKQLRELGNDIEDIRNKEDN